ncbi:glycosyltransferase family 39 protein [Thermococcus stetteri]|uniref:glycosyltransferase family 39 protein n=1 Tax=Thermococcus stetteri TaxID=49900 RepID=UPI0037421567|nr:hypothetical protein [Thermococcus stetteri]
MKRFERIFEPKVALSLITLIAVVFRVIPLRYKYLFGYDPYFHLAYIEESLKAGEWINFLTIAGGPWGFLIKNFHPLGLWMVPADVYKILKIFGVSLYDAFRITPVIFGVLTIIFFYLTMLNFYGKREAFFSALFLSVMFGHVFRSMANYYRGDNYMLFWYSVALFGVSLALKKTRRSWRYKRFAFYLIPAFASGLAAIFWQAYYPMAHLLIATERFLSFLHDRGNYKRHNRPKIILTRPRRVLQDNQTNPLAKRSSLIAGELKVFTDEYSIYDSLKEGLGVINPHERVNHSGREFARGEVHVNSCENRHGFLRAYLRKYRVPA